VASLLSVPFQSNWDFGVGPGPNNDTRYLLNFKPVMPFPTTLMIDGRRAILRATQANVRTTSSSLWPSAPACACDRPLERFVAGLRKVA
jgi:hypothetical protein